MSESTVVAIDIQGARLRFAELQRAENDRRLRRLSERQFAFDAAGDLFHADTPEHLRRITDELGDVLQAGAADEMIVLVHPNDAYSFFTPLSAELSVRDRKRQLVQQAALLTGTRSADELHLDSQTVRTAEDAEGNPVMWVHVLALPEAVHARVGEMASVLPVDRYRWMISTEATTYATARVELTDVTQTLPAAVTQEQALRPFTLAVGQYEGHTEYTLARDRQWFHSLHTEEADTPEDRTYYAAALLNRLEIPLKAVGRLFLYGHRTDPSGHAPLRTIFDVDPDRLNPVETVVDERSDTERPAPDVGMFVPCVGAAIAGDA
jgi:hypothetical protein